MCMGQTDFKRLFMALSRLYLKPDWTENDFIKAQRLRWEIIDARNNRTIESTEYHVLSVMASYLVDAMRDVLRKG